MVKKQATKKVEKKSVIGRFADADKSVSKSLPKKPVTKTKRKDSRQVKIERLETEINLLAPKLDHLFAENKKLEDRNDELCKILDNVVGESLSELGKKVDSVYAKEIGRLKMWVWILSGTLVAYAVLNIVLGFYGI